MSYSKNKKGDILGHSVYATVGRLTVGLGLLHCDRCSNLSR